MRILLILLWLLPTIAMADDTLGRLFTTPAERGNLNAQRQLRKIQEPDAAKAEERGEASPELPQAVSVQGFVKRSDGKNGTVWVNQIPVQEGASTADIEVGKLKRESNQVQLKLPTTGKKFTLKAGQVYIPETGSISDTSTDSQTSKRINASSSQSSAPATSGGNK